MQQKMLILTKFGQVIPYHPMYNLTFASLFCFCFLASYSAHCQNTEWLYHRQPNKIKVYGTDGQEMSMAWCGGVNNPQFAMADLNHDGKNDLVILERETFLRTFINIGNKGEVKYRYDHRYENNFPEVRYYIKLEDFTKDGIPDLWHYGHERAGAWTCIGYYNQNNELSFRDCKGYTHGNMVNIGVNPYDMPAIADVDGDGDLDIVSYSQFGIRITLYVNQQTELGLGDKVKFEKGTTCWGGMYQVENYRPRQMNWDCGEKPAGDAHNKSTGGSHGLCLFDADGDGDYDVLDAAYNLPDVQFLTNGRIPYNNLRDTMIAQDTLWPTGKKQVNLPNFPTGFWLDIDNDGDKDLLFSPMISETENYRCIHFYKNTGSDANPNFTFQTDTLLLNDMIDLGSRSFPTLYDYNKDGKQDLFVSGSYFDNGNFYSRISYYENTGTPGNPSLTLRTTDFNLIGTEKYIGAAITIGDLDGDKIDDMIIGRADGTLKFYRNRAANNSITPDWALMQGDLSAGSTTIDVGGNAAPFIYDFDKDGFNDLIIGNMKGTLVYYKSQGKATGQKPLLQHATNMLGRVKTLFENNIYGYSVPYIGKTDNTGKEYLLVGNNKGILYRYTFTHGDTTAFTMLDSAYSNIKVGDRFGYAAPTAGDIDGDGRLEMIVGLEQGGLQLLEQLFNVSVPPFGKNDQRLNIYPNPATEDLQISVGVDVQINNDRLQVYNILGQAMPHLPQRQINAYTISVDVSSLPAGSYICSLLIDGNIKTGMFNKK